VCEGESRGSKPDALPLGGTYPQRGGGEDAPPFDKKGGNDVRNHQRAEGGKAPAGEREKVLVSSNHYDSFHTMGGGGKRDRKVVSEKKKYLHVHLSSEYIRNPHYQ